ncbi:MAG: YcxB family protein [Caldilineaceae bacterium]
MQYEVTIHYTEELIHSTVTKAFLRTIGWYLAVVVPVAALFVWRLQVGDRGWLAGSLGALTLILLAWVYLVYLTHLRHALSAVRKLDSSSAIFRFNNEGIVGEVSRGSFKLPWKSVKKVLRLPQAWLVYYDNNYMTLPTSDLSDDIRNYIAEQVKIHGGALL